MLREPSYKLLSPGQNVFFKKFAKVGEGEGGGGGWQKRGWIIFDAGVVRVNSWGDAWCNG